MGEVRVVTLYIKVANFMPTKKAVYDIQPFNFEMFPKNKKKLYFKIFLYNST